MASKTPVETRTAQKLKHHVKIFAHCGGHPSENFQFFSVPVALLCVAVETRLRIGHEGKSQLFFLLVRYE